MDVIYEPGLSFGGNCILTILVVMAGIAAIGLIGTGIVWAVSRARPKARPFVTAPAGIGAVMAIIMGAGFLFNDESMVRVATDWTILEHRYCSGTQLVIKEHSLAAVTRTKYRKVVTYNKSNRVKRISHYLDIYVKSRVPPISVTLDALPSEVNLNAVERLAPNVMIRFRREQQAGNS